MNANQIRRQDSNRASIVLFCVLLLSGAFGYMAYDLSNALLRDRSPFAQRKIEVLSQQQYRFREIYHGPSTEAHHQGGGMTTGFASTSAAGQSISTRYGQGGSYSAAARPSGASTASAGSSAGGGALHTSSSQSAHSYGGGSSVSMGNTVSGQTSSPSAMPASSYSTPVLAYSRLGSTRGISASTTLEEPAVMSGPRRIGGDDEELDGDDPGQDVGEIGTEKPGAPIGDMPIVLLMLLCAGYAVWRWRESEDRILL